MAAIFRSSKHTPVKKVGASYYHRENLLLTVQDFNKLIGHLNGNSTLKTHKKLQIKGCNLNDINIKSIKSVFGEEDYKITEGLYFIENESIYYYKYRVKNFKYLMQLHFYNNIFFFGATKIYTDHIISDIEKREILECIAEKYCPDHKISSFEVDIVDSDGNLLSTYDDLNLYVRYIPDNPTVEDLINRHSEYVRPIKSGTKKGSLNDIF